MDLVPHVLTRKVYNLYCSLESTDTTSTLLKMMTALAQKTDLQIRAYSWRRRWLNSCLHPMSWITNLPTARKRKKKAITFLKVILHWNSSWQVVSLVLVGLFFYDVERLPHSVFVVSRTCTAPFDRLKIFLITRPPELGGPSSLAPANAKVVGVKIITNAVARIYSEGGVLAFWTGNSLSIAKIFPESAIKFLSYESSVSCFFTMHHFRVTSYPAFNRNGPLPNTGTR